MVLCISPQCANPENSENSVFCQSCGSELLLEGRYRVVKTIGQGGFGKTYEVREVVRTTGNCNSDLPKVLKVLMDTQPKAVELFTREAQVLGQLRHPGIPRVDPDGYFVFWPRDSQTALHCLIMEKVEGLDLGGYMQQRQRRPISEQLALEWLTQVVSILHEVHQRQFFHRDIKPPNIMLRPDGQLVLIDFGAVRAVTQTYMAKQGVQGVTGIHSMGFTPPEQLNGQAVQQSDFFALGRTFVYLLTGKEPTNPDIYDAYNDECRWRQFNPSLSSQLADLIDQLMARLPRDRPANTQDILQRLAAADQALHQLGNPSLSTTETTQSVQSNPVAAQPPSFSSQPVVPPTDIQIPAVSQSQPGNESNSPSQSTQPQQIVLPTDIQIPSVPQPPPLVPPGAPNTQPPDSQALQAPHNESVAHDQQTSSPFYHPSQPPVDASKLAEAQKNIKIAWIAGLILSVLTLITTLASAESEGAGFQLLDVLLMGGLTFGIYKKNRVCAVAMLVYACLLLLRLLINDFSVVGILLVGILIYCYAQGVRGTFAYYQSTRSVNSP